MAGGPRPTDNYNPIPENTPSLSAPNNAVNIRATPDAFGAKVGEALQTAGDKAAKGGQDLFDTGMKWQGLINETTATNAETDQYAPQAGSRYGAYKSLTGLAAVNGKDQAVNDIIALRHKIRDTLPNAGARRAFDIMAARRESYMLQDINSYAAGEVKHAAYDSAEASMDLTVDDSSRPSVANNDTQFDEGLVNINFQIPKVLPKYGIDTSNPATKPTVDPKTGALVFPKTPEGQQAQAIVDNLVHKYEGPAWENRLLTLAYDSKIGNISNAINTLEKNKDRMPSAVYAKMSHEFYPAARAEEVHGAIDTSLQNISNSFHTATTDPAASTYPQFNEQGASLSIERLFPGSFPTSGKRTPEHNAAVGGVADSMHIRGEAVDFTPPVDDHGHFLNLNEIRYKLRQQGLPVTELIAEKGDKPVSDISQADHIHWGWGVKGKPPIAGLQPSDSMSQEDFLLAHNSEIIDRETEAAAKANPHWGAAEQDLFRSGLTSRLNQQISQANGQLSMKKNDLVKYAMDNNLSDLSDLAGASPEIQQEYRDVESKDDFWLRNFTNSLRESASRGQAANYGSEWYQLLGKIMSGDIKDVSQLPDIGYGPNALLTNTGLKSLLSMAAWNNSNDPTRASFNVATMQFLEKARGLVTGTGIAPRIRTTQLDEKFNKYIASIMPKIEDGIAHGKTADDLFNEKSQDFVGWPPATPLPTIQKEITMHAVQDAHDKAVAAKEAASKPLQINTPNDLMAATRAGKITSKAQFYQIAKKHKWFQANKQKPDKPVDIFSEQ